MSGLAINSLVEQGTQTLAEINDNYIWGRREVGEQTMELVKFDSRTSIRCVVGEGKARKIDHAQRASDLGQQYRRAGDPRTWCQRRR
jgi:uncharacterized protein YraI